jgi:hypothetical protein
MASYESGEHYLLGPTDLTSSDFSMISAVWQGRNAASSFQLGLTCLLVVYQCTSEGRDTASPFQLNWQHL